MITERKRFVITSDTICIPSNMTEFEEYADAERAQQIVNLAELINEETDNQLASYDCINLANKILLKYTLLK